MKTRIKMLLLLIFTSTSLVYAIDPSGSRINENPHSPFEMYIPIVILVIFILCFLILRLGALLGQKKDDVDSKQKETIKNVVRPSPTNSQKVGYRSPVVSKKRKSVDLYLLKATEAGSPEAQYELANWYYKESQSDDYAGYNSKEAVKWYKNAARQGHSAAMKKLVELGDTNVRTYSIADNEKFKKQIKRK